ncbi:MAG: tetratricopeptide repeat protein [Bacteroidales bacterium]|nr:tetratricopeptide repeat protein [Bacteroidales bacterium]
MDILSKPALTLAGLLISVLLFSQDFDKQLKAFEKSYAFESEKNYSAAIKELQGVYQADDYETNLRLGWLTYSDGRYAEALSYYQKCIGLRPLSVEARLGFVNPAAALGNWSQVEAQYNEILKADPMNTTANYRMGLITYNREDFATALKHFTIVLNLYPFDYDTAIMMAWTQYKLGKLREAKIMFQKALLMNPGDSSALEGLKLIR